MKTFYVYELVRPDNTVFYVGKGTGKRVKDHAREAKRNHFCHKCNVIRKLWNSGSDFSSRIVFRTSNEQEALDQEIKLIAKYGRDNLTNATDGGQGLGGWVATDSFREKQRQNRLKQWQDPEYRAQATQRLREMSSTPEWREQVSAWMIGNNNGKGNIGRWGDPIQHEELRQRNFERWANQEEKDKLAERNKRPDVRDKQSETKKRQWADPAFRAKMLAARNKNKT